jgi:predicted transcriptional regulator with HTH domain
MSMTRLKNFQTNNNRYIGKESLVHNGIISVVKRVEFITGGNSYVFTKRSLMWY